MVGAAGPEKLPRAVAGTAAPSDFGFLIAGGTGNASWPNAGTGAPSDFGFSKIGGA